MVLPQHPNGVYVRNLARPLQNPNFPFLSILEVELLMCFKSLACCITQFFMSFKSQSDPLRISAREQNSWFQQIWQVAWALKQQCIPTPRVLISFLLLWNNIFTQDVRGLKVSKNPQNITQKAWGSSMYILFNFIGKLEMTLCVPNVYVCPLSF